jgi:hypothetical protein
LGRQGEVVKKKTAFWDKKNPNKKSTPLTPAQKAKAKASAKKAGRPYPNLVDNAAAKRKAK